jgi:type II secretory pathway component PulJ
MKQKLSRLPAAGGYSVVELIIAVGMVIVGLGIYAVFNSASRSSQSQKIYNDADELHPALDQMKTELTSPANAPPTRSTRSPRRRRRGRVLYRDDHA